MKIPRLLLGLGALALVVLPLRSHAEDVTTSGDVAVVTNIYQGATPTEVSPNVDATGNVVTPDGTNNNPTQAPVPEPASLLLMLSGLAGLAGFRKFKKH